MFRSFFIALLNRPSASLQQKQPTTGFSFNTSLAKPQTAGFTGGPFLSQQTQSQPSLIQQFGSETFEQTKYLDLKPGLKATLEELEKSINLNAVKGEQFRTENDNAQSSINFCIQETAKLQSVRTSTATSRAMFNYLQLL